MVNGAFSFTGLHERLTNNTSQNKCVESILQQKSIDRVFLRTFPASKKKSRKDWTLKRTQATRECSLYADDFSEVGGHWGHSEKAEELTSYSNEELLLSTVTTDFLKGSKLLEQHSFQQSCVEGEEEMSQL